MTKKGEHHSKEHCIKLSEAVKKSYINNPKLLKLRSDNMKRLREEKRITAWNKGRKMDKPSWNKGLKKETDSRVKKYSQNLIGRKRPDLSKYNKENPPKLEKNGRWLGGISFEPYDKRWNESFKNKIRKRDNQICMLCNIHREKLKIALCVHHINYNKKLTIPQNCVALCNSCHIKTNSNRTHWIKFFQSLLSERYGYQYTELNEPIINL